MVIKKIEGYLGLLRSGYYLSGGRFLDFCAGGYFMFCEVCYGMFNEFFFFIIYQCGQFRLRGMQCVSCFQFFFRVQYEVVDLVVIYKEGI